MAESSERLIRSVVQEETSSEEDEVEFLKNFYYYDLLHHYFTRIKRNVKKIPHLTNLITKKDKNQRSNISHHVALKNIKQDTDKFIDIIEYLIDDGASINISYKNETSLDLLEKQSKKVINFKWDDIKNICQVKKTKQEEMPSEKDEDENLENFYDLLSAVKQYNLKRIKRILQKIPHITNLITKKDKNQIGNTSLHVALKNIKEDTDQQKVIHVIKYLIDNGASINIRNYKNETSLDLLEKQSEKVANFKWDDIKNIFQIEKTKEEISIEKDEDEDLESFYDLLSAEKQYNLKRIIRILQKVPNITNLLTKKDKNQIGNTSLHVALKNIKEDTDHQKVIDVIKYLIANGASININNYKNETPLDLLEKQSEKIANFKWDDIKNIFQVEKSKQDEINISKNLAEKIVKQQIIQQPSELMTMRKQIMPKYYKTTQGAKRTLHGYTYQLKLIMLFLQRIPEWQPFFKATEMDEAHKFDDVVLKYQDEGVWKYRFVQVKHKHEEEYEIKKSDLFIIDGKQQSDTRYFISEYYDSFCKIAAEGYLSDGIRDEFLLCTNIKFSKIAESYFKQIEDRDDLLLTYPTVKYQLNIEKIEELRKLLQINRTNDNYFLEFIEKFKFLVNVKDDDIYKLINEALEKYLKLKNIDFATSIVQDRLLNWFERYKNNKSEFLIENKNEFLKSLNDAVGSLFAAGYSNFYIRELRTYGLIFKNPLPELKHALSDTIGLFVLVTLSPKISTIKLCQIIKELKLLQDQVILLSTNKLQTHEQVIDTFCYDNEYQLLVIECERGEKICKAILNKILQASRTKKVVIVGQQEDVENLSEERFCDIGRSFETLNEESQDQLLRRQVIFQGRKISLNQLINLSSAEEIIDDLILEELLLDTIKIGDALKISNTFVDDYYISRTLLKKNMESIFQDEEVLKKSYFFNTDINEGLLEQSHVEHKMASEWQHNSIVPNGIFLFLKSHRHQENLEWIEWKNGQIFFKEINKCDLNILDTGLQEVNLYPKEITDNKIIIIAGGPGFGKTTFIQRVANNFKKITPDIWVLQVDLKSCMSNKGKSLKDISFKKTDVHAAIEFLADICLFWNYESSKKTISRKILVESLQNNNKPSNMYPKIILLFDGFDAISPRFKEQTLILLQALKSSNVTQLWITTRSCEETSLEIGLDSLAFHLKPITEKEKERFLSKFWEYQLVKLVKMKKEYESELITLFTKLCKNFDQFERLDYTDCPLHLTMLAEVIFKRVIGLEKYGECKNMTLSFLYNEFLTIKTREIYFIDKRQEDYSLLDQELFECSLHFLRKNLQEISFKILFSQDNIQLKYSNDLAVKLAKRVRLLIPYSDDLQFVHRSFAEYFVCDYFVENFESENIQCSIFQVLTDNNYQLIRKFLNDNQEFLQKCSSENNYLITVINRSSDYSYLYRMAKEKNYNLIINHLRNIPCNLPEKIVMFITNDEKETILHWICREVDDDEMFINLFNSIRKCVADTTLEQLLLKMNEKKQTVFNLIINTSFYELSNKKFRILLDVLKDQPEMICRLLSQVDYLGNTVLHEACQRGLNEIVIFILESVKGNPKILKNLLIKENALGQIPLHCVFVDYFPNSVDRIISTIQNMINFSKHVLGPKFLCEMMFHMDYDGNTALHLAYQMQDSLSVKFLLEQFKDDPDTLKWLLIETNIDGQSVLHCIFLNDSCGSSIDHSIFRLKETIDFITPCLNAKELYRILLQPNKDGNTILNLACITASDKCVRYLLKAVEGNHEVCNAFLLKLNKHRHNILHSILLDVNKNQVTMILILKEIINFITIHFSSDILYNLLLQVDCQGNTALHFAFMLRSYDGATHILDAVKDNFLLAKKLVLIMNKNGQNIIHCIFTKCQHHQQEFDSRSSILNMFIDLVTVHFNSDVVLALLLQDDNEGNTSLHSACMAHSVQCVHSLIELVKDIPEILTQFLLRINSKGQNILHCVFNNRDENFDEENEILCFLVDLIKCHINYDVLKNLLLQSDNEGNNVLHLASMFGSNKSITSLLEAGKVNNILKELMLKTNGKGRSMLQCILFSHYDTARYDKIKLKLQIVINVITNYNYDLLCDILLQADKNGNTALHSACNMCANEVVSDLLEAIKGNHKVVSKLLLKKNLQGKTALHYILIKKDIYTFEMVTLTLQEIVGYLNNYDSQILYNLLLETDNQGYSALHFACALRSNQGISYLIEAVESNTEVLNELILKTNYYGQSALHCTILVDDVNASYLELIETDTTKILLELVKYYCDSEVLKKLFLQTDNENHTALHMTCQRISDEILLCKRKQVLINSNGDAAYESNYFKRPYISRLNILIGFMKEVCPEILSEIVCKRDDIGTILHIICNDIYIGDHILDEEDNNKCHEESEVKGDKEEYLAQSIKLDMLFYFLETVKDDIELLNRLLLTTNNHGQTALHYTIYKFENPDMFKLLFNFVQVNCRGEIVKELLYKADDDGCTILHLACKGKKEILMGVMNALEGINEPLGDFFLKKDKWEHNALDNALRNFGTENIVQEYLKLWNKHTNIENAA